MSEVLAAIASFGLAAADPVSDEPLADHDWLELIRQVGVERIEGLLAAAVEAGHLAVTEEQFETVRARAHGRAQVDLRIEREALRVSSVLQGGGVAHRLVKGPALAHRFYPDPSWRGFGDVDVLVDGSDWYRSVSLLEEGGSKRSVPEVRPGFDRRFGKEATLVARSGVEIDLHRTLVVGPYGLWVDLPALFARPPAWLPLGAATVPVLDPAVAFLQCCYNAALADDPPRLIALRDVAQMALGGSFPSRHVEELADVWRGRSVVARAVRLAEQRLGVDLAATEVGHAFGPERTRFPDRALMWTYRGSGRGYTSQLAGAVAVPGLAAKLGYLSALLKPQDEYLRARGWSARQYARHAARRLVSRR